MLTYKQATLYFLMTTVLVFLWHLGYKLHFFNYEPLWHVIHLTQLWTGWLGSFLILLSLGYSLRKRKIILWGSVTSWMNAHMLLALMGSFIITFHCYGKLYGIAALAYILMWIVTLSGFFGMVFVQALRSHANEQLSVLSNMPDTLQQSEAQILSALEKSSRAIEQMNLPEMIAHLQKPDKKLPKTGWKRLFITLREFRRTRKEIATELSKINRAQHEITLSSQKRSKEVAEAILLQRNIRHHHLSMEFFANWRNAHVVPSYWMIFAIFLHCMSFLYY